MKTLKAIQDNVKKMYYEGKPLHHLPSTRSIELEPNSSSVFVVEHADFVKMAPQVIQDIFRLRHILVTGCAHEDNAFDEESLSMVADIDYPWEITGELFL